MMHLHDTYSIAGRTAPMPPAVLWRSPSRLPVIARNKRNGYPAKNLPAWRSGRAGVRARARVG